MARTASFTKRALITKANSTMVIATAAAAFIVVFTLIASKALISQASYQNKVIAVKKKAYVQLKSDLNARDTLVGSYQAFVNTNQNVLGGNPKGSGDQDGDNAKIILDALPSKYDFPALATSLEKLIGNQGMSIVNITGVDQEVTQQANQVSSVPIPVAMPFQAQVSGSYPAVQNLIAAFDRSIRPFQIQTLEMSGDQNNMTVNVTAQTFYQPEKSLKITKEVVK